MRRALVAAACLGALAIGNTASAQDYMDTPEKRWNHGGFYAGIVGGYTAGQLQTPGLDLGAAGAQGGIVAGWGVSNRSGLYLGLEADAVLKDLKWTVTDVGGTATASSQWTGSMRARIGQEFGPILAYLTGGAAVGGQRLAVTGMGADEELRWGWVAGGGMQAQITRTMSIRVEGLHYTFPDKAFWLNGSSANIGTGETVARVGVTFKLD